VVLSGGQPLGQPGSMEADEENGLDFSGENFDKG
jgi:hypothetical protein